jgi:type VI secretion system protein ImpA
LTDITKLLEPVAQDAPCGPNLEYDPEFLVLEQSAQGKPEQVLGNNVVPGEEPDWADVVRRAEALLARTKDLRVAVVYTRARTRRDQLRGLADGLALIAKLLGDYWDGVHPHLDPDEADDATARLNALAALGGADGLLVDVRVAQVVRPGPYGRLAVRDLLLAAGKLQPTGGDKAPSEAEVRGVLNAVPKEDWDELAAAGEALGHLKTLEHVLVEKVGAAQATDLKPLGDTLRAVAQACATVTGAVEPGAGGEDGAGAGSAAGRLVVTGEVRTREEALRLLDKVCAYMERSEPANPAPLLIRRAQRLMAMSFVEIIEDLAPDAISQVRTVAGIRGE